MVRGAQTKEHGVARIQSEPHLWDCRKKREQAKNAFKNILTPIFRESKIGLKTRITIKLHSVDFQVTLSGAREMFSLQKESERCKHTTV